MNVVECSNVNPGCTSFHCSVVLISNLTVFFVLASRVYTRGRNAFYALFQKVSGLKLKVIVWGRYFQRKCLLGPKIE